MISTEGDIVLAYNGEIYNHGDLRAELNALGHTYRSRTDTETVLHAYEAWGLGALHRFNGMFALALLDRRSGELVLAVDRRGIKPLYYAQVGRTLIFASELKALLRARLVPSLVDPTALWLFLCLGFVPAPHCIAVGVRKLKPGEILRFRDGDVTLTSFDPPRRTPDRLPPQVARERLREALDAAVRRQLAADVPVGAFLSGGIDSTLLVALAQQHSWRALHTFSVGYLAASGRITRAAYNDDLMHARQVAERLGTVHHEALVSADDGFGTLLADLVEQLDEPMVEPALVSTHALAQRARSEGVPVVLTGDGADELFGGYPRYFAAQRLALYERLPGLKPMVPLLAGLSKLHALGKSLRQLQFLLGRTRVQQYLTFSTIFSPDQALELIHPELRAAVETLALEQVVSDAMPAAGSLADGMAETDLRLWVAQHFNPRLDRMTMRHSVEARVPFQDDEVVQAAWAVVLSERTRRSRPKAILVEAFRELLPDAVLRRPKRHFQAPRDRWLPLVLNNVLHRVVEEQGVPGAVFTPAAFQEQLRLRGSATPGGSLSTWALVIAAVWTRRLRERSSELLLRPRSSETASIRELAGEPLG
jgi:asparagine synthase (glutamine-hydrolysing)